MRARDRNSRRTSLNGHIDRLDVGFVPTLDCATLIAARELGLFEKHHLDVRLSREVGWATIREKLLHQELDAAATHASMLFSIHCGLGVVARPCLTGLIIASQGSAITLSNELWDLGARGVATIGRIAREKRRSKPLVFGVVMEYSTQHYLLREWLKSGGIDPDHDVHIVVIPSGLIYENFEKKFLDGYCVAEPWNSTAVKRKTGWVVATGSEAALPQPEKVLLVLRDFVEQRQEAHLRLIAALIEASRFCEAPEHRAELARMLARPGYFDVPEDHLRNSLLGPFDSGRGLRPQEKMISFDARAIGAPTAEAGASVFDLVKSLRPAASTPTLRREAIAEVFREDIYEQALALATASEDQPGLMTN